MKKLLLSLACASAVLPGVAQASSFQDIATVSFTATSSTANLLLSWVDLVSYNSNKLLTLESDGKYWLTLTNSSTKEVVLDANNISSAVTGDVSGVKSGSFTETLNSLVAGTSYTVSFLGKWTGKSGGNWQTISTPSVNASVAMAPVPEPGTYAMFLAGLGIIGAIAKRRERA